MCGIWLYLGKDDSYDEDVVLEKAEKIKPRGPDMSSSQKIKFGNYTLYLNFYRLAIMDLSEKGMQPFFIQDENSLVDLVKQFLAKSKSFIEPMQFQRAIRNLELDYRLKFSNNQLCLQIEPDGWVSKKLVVKLRYDEAQRQTVLLQCQGGWASAENLYLTIHADDGSIEKVKINTQDKFVLTLEAPKTRSSAYASWRIETRQYFVPSQVRKRSKDHRALSFRVDAISLE